MFNSGCTISVLYSVYLPCDGSCSVGQVGDADAFCFKMRAQIRPVIPSLYKYLCCSIITAPPWSLPRGEGVSAPALCVSNAAPLSHHPLLGCAHLWLILACSRARAP